VSRAHARKSYSLLTAVVATKQTAAVATETAPRYSQCSTGTLLVMHTITSTASVRAQVHSNLNSQPIKAQERKYVADTDNRQKLYVAVQRSAKQQLRVPQTKYARPTNTLPTAQTPPSRRTASSFNAHAHHCCQPPGPSATAPSRAVAEGPMPRDPGPQRTSRCSLAGQRAVCRVACISQVACAWHAHAARAGLESQPNRGGALGLRGG